MDKQRFVPGQDEQVFGEPFLQFVGLIFELFLSGFGLRFQRRLPAQVHDFHDNVRVAIEKVQSAVLR